MTNFLSAPVQQKAAPAFLFVYDSTLGDWKAFETAGATATTGDIMDFKDAPNQQKTHPSCLFVYDSTLTGWRAATSTDMSGGIQSRGVVDASTGSRDVVVSGLSLAGNVADLTPSITLIKPTAGSDHLTYNVIGSTISLSGFTVELSASPTETGYRLVYSV